MRTVCEVNDCVGCGACKNICPKNAIEIKDELKNMNAYITSSCINCDSCKRVCQCLNHIDKKRPIKWYQGWSKSESVQSIAASGGVASAIALSIIRQNGVVWGCYFINGNFEFGRAEDESMVISFSGSKYVKSNFTKAYHGILSDLKNGYKTLVIGLPCQISGLKLFLNNKYNENLYTIDLICHGTPSQKLFNRYLSENNIDLSTIEDIRFRQKSTSNNSSYKKISKEGIADSYSLAFQHELSFTENCYSCRYSGIERVSDVTLGDSWGSLLDSSNTAKGVSLILCQTTKGIEIVQNAKIELRAVDLERAINSNEQLKKPATANINRNKFFYGLTEGKTIDKLVSIYLKKQKFRQLLKKMMMVLGIKKPNSIMYQISYKKK